MKWPINYIRTCFCKHDFEKIHEGRMFDKSVSAEMPIGYIYVYRCKKCGHIQKVRI
jgi:hypothetical protein